MVLTTAMTTVKIFPWVWVKKSDHSAKMGTIQRMEHRIIRSSLHFSICYSGLSYLEKILTLSNPPVRNSSDNRNEIEAILMALAPIRCGKAAIFFATTRLHGKSFMKPCLEIRPLHTMIQPPLLTRLASPRSACPPTTISCLCRKSVSGKSQRCRSKFSMLQIYRYKSCKRMCV